MHGDCFAYSDGRCLEAPNTSRVDAAPDGRLEVGLVSGIVHALLLVVLAGDLSHVLLLDQQLRQELLSSMEKCLQDKTNFEIISTPQGACIAELWLTMARLRGGPPFASPPSASPPAVAGALDYWGADRLASVQMACSRDVHAVPPTVDAGACCFAVLERLEKIEAVLTATIGKEEIKENVSLLTELVPKRSRQGSPRGEIGSCSSSRPRPSLWHPAASPGVGARGFLCNLRNKGFYGLRGSVVSMEETRACVRIDETGMLATILRANLVFDANFPECVQMPLARGPLGPPGLLLELIFFASHPGLPPVAAVRGSVGPPLSQGFGALPTTQVAGGFAEPPTFDDTVSASAPATSSFERPTASSVISEVPGPPMR